MESGPYGPEYSSDIDRCIAFMVQFAARYGEPRIYDVEQQVFHRPPRDEVPDALVRRGQIEVQDMAHLPGVAPITYEVAVYTPGGITKSGLVASLTQPLETLLKAVHYQFTVDKTVEREVITARGIHREAVHPEEVSFLAEQLASLHPVER